MEETTTRSSSAPASPAPPWRDRETVRLNVNLTAYARAEHVEWAGESRLAR